MSEAHGALAFPGTPAEPEEPAWLGVRHEPIRPVVFARVGGGETGLPIAGAEEAAADGCTGSEAATDRDHGTSEMQHAPQPRISPARETPPPGSQSVLPPVRNLEAELEAELSARIEAFARAATEMAAARARIVHEVEGQLLDLAVDIAEAIVEREVERDPQLHVSLARAALSGLASASGAKLRASREAYAAITSVVGEPVVEHEGVRIEVHLDTSLEGLGCVADDEVASVDGRVSERLRAVRRALEDERRQRSMEDEE